MFDDIIKPVENRIFPVLFLGEINPFDFTKGFEIWGQKTLKNFKKDVKEITDVQPIRKLF